MSISGLGTSASSLLAQLQQQLLGGFVAANSANSTNSTDSTGQAGNLALFGGNDTSGQSGAPNSTDTSPTGGPIAFGPGVLSAILSQLEAQSSSSSSTATTSNSTDASSNSTDAASNSTDATGNATGADPIAQALFSAISGGGSTITKSELEAAFTANGSTANSADALYSKLSGSSNGDDGITLSEFQSSLAKSGGPGGPGGPGGAGGPPPGGPPPGGPPPGGSVGGSQGASSSGSSTSNSTDATKTVTNADGSTTTTITYADGTTITITEPAAVTASNASWLTGNGSNNSTELDQQHQFDQKHRRDQQSVGCGIRKVHCPDPSGSVAAFRQHERRQSTQRFGLTPRDQSVPARPFRAGT